MAALANGGNPPNGDAAAAVSMPNPPPPPPPPPVLALALAPGTTSTSTTTGATTNNNSNRSSRLRALNSHQHDEDATIGEKMKTYLRDYFLGFVPPHIRRKGLQMPPLESMSRKFFSLLSFPYFPWASFAWPKYAKYVAGDVLGGLTVGIMLVPQGMAYAVLSSLPPIYGLYASTVAGYVYTFFGTSGQLTLGPVALVSLFMSEVFTSLGVSLASKDKDPVLNAEAQYHTYVREQMAAVVSFCAAMLLCGMALFRVGSLMKFISPSVLTGFVTGSASYIFISQSKYIWGFKVRREGEKEERERKCLYVYVCVCIYICICKRLPLLPPFSPCSLSPYLFVNNHHSPPPPAQLPLHLHTHTHLPKKTAPPRQGPNPRVPVPLLAHRHGLGQVHHGHRLHFFLRPLDFEYLPPFCPPQDPGHAQHPPLRCQLPRGPSLRYMHTHIHTDTQTPVHTPLISSHKNHLSNKNIDKTYTHTHTHTHTGTTLFVIIVATAVAYSLVKGGVSLPVIGYVCVCVCLCI
jgi:hypothetical protein